MSENDKRSLSVRRINKDRDYIIKSQLKGRRLIYVYETTEEISLDIKKTLMFAGFLPSMFKDKDEMILTAEELQPEVFLISTINSKNLEIIKEIKADKELSHIFVIGASIYKKSAEESYKAGADFYIPMPYVWKRLPYLIRALTFLNDLRYSSEWSASVNNQFEINFSGKGETIVEIRF